MKHLILSTLSFAGPKQIIKKRCLLFIIFIVTIGNVFGEIKNGYEKEIFQMRESLKSLNALLHINNNLSAVQRRKIEYRIDSLINNISNYELTKNLLEQFKIISPDLYSEIDTLKDNKGRNVDVFVKFIPADGTKIKAWGTTYMSQVDYDKDAYRSEYGEFTVSIKVWIVNKALYVLAHELGHVKYQVPYFATYMNYYKKNYANRIYSPPNLGHNANDLSGKSATQYVKRFRKGYIQFLRTKNEKIQSPLILIDRIRKNLTKIMTNPEPAAQPRIISFSPESGAAEQWPYWEKT